MGETHVEMSFIEPAPHLPQQRTIMKSLPQVNCFVLLLTILQSIPAEAGRPGGPVQNKMHVPFETEKTHGNGLT